MPSSRSKNIFVIDIGKTHVKTCLLDAEHTPISSASTANKVNTSGLYPAADIDELWSWMKTNIKNIVSEYPIGSIIFTTHGATCALINKDTQSLVLPVLDYEYTLLDELNQEYAEAKPDFSETYSPTLPAGLNLGKQLFWLQKNFPVEFSQATDVLMYPQYWAWRLTGKITSEITSLGCHTDLWSIDKSDYSSLVKNQGWQDLFPAITPAWGDLGTVSTDLVAELGIPEDCVVYSGIHDSNASFLRYRLSQQDNPFTVISTGTWTITMAANVDINNLNASKDMLANIDATGKPIACARFMGGREFGEICKLTQANVSDEFTLEDVEKVIQSGVFALPDFSGGSGPFGNAPSKFVGDVDSVQGIAVATLYCALMLDVQLSDLNAQGQVYIEGAFLKNPILCGVLAQLRPYQVINLSTDDTGTVLGATALTNWGQAFVELNTTTQQPTALNNLLDYKAKWRELVGANK